MQKSLGWGVVGTGEISRYVVSDLVQLDSARRSAVCSRSMDRATAFATEFEFERPYESIDELLGDDAVDIVYLGTPHATHADLAVQALQAGKHILVEKPAGIDAAEVERIAAASRAAGRFAMEGMWMKFHPYYRALLDDVRSGGIGDVGSLRASFGLPFGEPDSSRWSGGARSSTLLDQGIYPVTLAYDLFGEPSNVVASAHTRHDGVDLSVVSTLTFDDGRFAQIAASMVGYLDPSAAINGTAGWLSVPAPFWATDQYSRHAGSIGEALTAPETRRFEREGMGYVPMLRAVGEAIAQGRLEHPLHPWDAALAVARILDRIRAAAAHPESHLMETPR
jgi:predicted dehydrogenase